MSLNSAAHPRTKRAKPRAARETHVVALTDGPGEAALPSKTSPINHAHPLPIPAAQHNAPSMTLVNPAFASPPKAPPIHATHHTHDPAVVEKLKTVKSDILMGHNPYFHASPRPSVLEELSMVYNPPLHDPMSSGPHDRSRVPSVPPATSRQAVPQGGDKSPSQSLTQPSPRTVPHQITPRGNDHVGNQQNFPSSLSKQGHRSPGLEPSQVDFPHASAAGQSESKPLWDGSNLRDTPATVHDQNPNGMHPHTPVVSSFQNGKASLPIPQSNLQSSYQNPARSSVSGHAPGNGPPDSASRKPSFSGGAPQQDMRPTSVTQSHGTNDDRGGRGDNNDNAMIPMPMPQIPNSTLPAHRIPPRPPAASNNVPIMSGQRDVSGRMQQPKLRQSPSPPRTELPLLLKNSDVQAMEMARQRDARPSSPDHSTFRTRSASRGARDDWDRREQQPALENRRPYNATRNDRGPIESYSIDKSIPDDGDGRGRRGDEAHRSYGRPLGSSGAPYRQNLDHVDGRDGRGAQRSDPYEPRYADEPRDSRDSRPHPAVDTRSGGYSDLRPDERGRSDGYRTIPPRSPPSRHVLPSNKAPDTRGAAHNNYNRRTYNGINLELPRSSAATSHGPDMYRSHDPIRDPPAPYRQPRQDYSADGHPREPVPESRAYGPRREPYQPPPISNRAPSPTRSIRRGQDYDRPLSYPPRSDSDDWGPRDDRGRAAGFQSGPNSRAAWLDDRDRRDVPLPHSQNERSFSRERLPPPPSIESLKRHRDDYYDSRPQRAPSSIPSNVPPRGRSPPRSWNRDAPQPPAPRDSGSSDQYPPLVNFNSGSSYDSLSTRYTNNSDGAASARGRPRSRSPGYTTRPPYPSNVTPDGRHPSIPESDAARAAKRARMENTGPIYYAPPVPVVSRNSPPPSFADARRVVYPPVPQTAASGPIDPELKGVDPYIARIARTHGYLPPPPVNRAPPKSTGRPRSPQQSSAKNSPPWD